MSDTDGKQVEEEQTKKEFDAFPYSAYDIQLGFMQKLYETLEHGGIGLFESPTGTGKTMSLICGSLHWLEDWHKSLEDDTVVQGDGSDDEPDWMKEHATKLDRDKKKLQEELKAERMDKARAKLNEMKSSFTGRNIAKTVPGYEEDEEDEFLIGKQDDAESVIGRKRLSNYVDGRSSSDEEDIVLAEAPEEQQPKAQIFFVSRTHSQLVQFVGELKKTRFYPGMSLVSLGSRKQLCINPDVQKLSSVAMMNERCMDLQNEKVKKKNDKDKTVTKKTCRCPYLRRGSPEEGVMTDMILSEPMDIEELATLGKQRRICPYYASRSVSQETDIVLAPYSSVIVSDTRDSLGLDLTNSVVIVDEAHNLIDAINGSHSSTLSMEDAERAIHQIEFYFNRFKTRLSAYNTKTVQTLLLAAQSIFKGFTKGFGSSSDTLTVECNTFLFETNLDNINMFQLGRDITDNKLIFKMGGYWKNRVMQDGVSIDHPGTNSLQALIEFLKRLTYDDKDGRIIINKKERVIKYIMLNASMQFRGILDQAKSVVLASGTLSPLETIMPLFEGKYKENIYRFQCDHIVDPSRLLALAVPSGPSGKVFDFRHPHRMDPSIIADLGRAVVNVCNVTPGGIVVFFSSFAYCDQVIQAWKKDGILDRIQRKKDVYVEPRSAVEVESVLTQYSDSINNDSSIGGAILFSIVGGKLAEGINFGDDMGRCVIMVGLPYPNPSDPELQERMKFLDQTHQDSETNTSLSKTYYTNLCMKAVNQCIGRAIRHINDYACILLLDHRYCQTKSQISSKLSGWIQKSLHSTQSFGQAQGQIARFFKGIRNNNN